MDNGTSTPMYMPVAPAYGNMGFGGGFGGDGWWIILLLLFAGGGWGNGGFGGGNSIYPWMNQADITTSGFQNQMLNTQLSGIQGAVTSGFGDLQTALCGGFAGVNATVNGAQNAIAQQLYSNEIASLNRSFAEQTASTQGFNNVQSQLANCCCENRLATANLTAVVQAENCADRAALSDGLRDIIVNQTANTQKIIDMMCQDKIDAKNEKILELQNQLNMTNLAASQFAQTQQIIAAIPTTTAPAA